MGDSPAFSFYAKDFMLSTVTMSLAERGAYITLLSYQWDRGAIPADLPALARLCGCSVPQARAIWKVLGPKFVLGEDGLLRNARLEQERVKQAERREQLAANGRLGGRPPKANANLNGTNRFHSGLANGKQNESLPSPSPSPSPDPVPVGRPRHATLIASPLDFERLHGSHVTGFCAFVCLPSPLWDGWVNRVMSSGLSLDAATAQVRQWAEGVKATWQGSGKVPGGTDYEFWRAEWVAAHPAATKPAKPAPGGSHADRLAAIEMYRRPS
jgi:uncharacterized protein YdaU (DUF1376 family)